MHPSRRSFLQAAGGAAFASGQAAAADPGWFDRPMRWAQLTLVEDDPGKFDRRFWLDYFRRTHSDAACLSAGGCVAYYPTEIPLHHRSAWMGSGDPFGELLAGCRQMNMVVIARTDPHAVHQDAYDAHPDWIAVDAEGKRRRHWAAPELWVTCALGPYNFEFMTEVHREIMSRYRVDGIFSNRWAGSGMCYCEHCRRNFKAAAGMELPRGADPQDPARRAYLGWHQQRLFELWRLWDSEIRKINPGARYIANAGGGALSPLDMKTIGELSDILFADRQARRGVAAPWSNGKNGKEYRATLGRKPVGGIFSVGVEEPYRWKDSVQSEAEIRIWVADGVANGLRPWFTKFSGTLHDHRWLKVVEDIYTRLHRDERYLRNEAPLARVAMVYSQQTAQFYGGARAAEKVEHHTLGFYHALVEARIPFEMVHDRLLDPAHVDQFKALILPNIAALSTGQCRQLREYVQRGGSLVATFETSLYDEWGVRRRNFGLSDLFGVWFKGRVEGPMQNSYLRLEDKSHSLLRGLEDAGRIINGVSCVDVGALEKFPNPPLTLIPSYPDLPMEEVYPRVPKTDIPEVYLREVGRGRVVYFPWDIDRTFWEVLSVDHGKLLANAVDWAAQEERPVTVTGPGVLDV
ncbi:MAG: beta-galactosidase trimerization domain-containing protein, partial [Candidatus Solibacter usitatus]|nr:beta-galactosidase trimerization domain-containing protein [Candidatus Solibacter usitatus]